MAVCQLHVFCRPPTLIAQGARTRSTRERSDKECLEGGGGGEGGEGEGGEEPDPFVETALHWHAAV